MLPLSISLFDTNIQAISLLAGVSDTNIEA